MTPTVNGWYAMQPPEGRAGAETSAEILIYGDIGEDWLEETTTARAFVADLQGLSAETIVVRLNSYGGSVTDGLAIYNSLRRHGARIETVVDGAAFSTAALIAMAGDRREIAENALFMIHAPWSLGLGNSAEFRDMADMLDKYADAMTTSFTRVLGRDRAGEVRGLLTDGDDHFFTAAEARAAGYFNTVAPAFAGAGLPHVFHFDEIAAGTGRLKPAAAAAFRPAAAAASIRQERPMITSPTQESPAAEADHAHAGADGAPARQPDSQALDAARAAAREAALDGERERRQGIRAAYRPFLERSGVAELQDAYLDNPETTVEAARHQLLNKLGEGSEALGTAMHTGQVGAGVDEREKKRGAMSAALLARMGALAASEARDHGANPYRGMRLAEMARECLDGAGVATRGQAPEEFAPQALTRQVQGGAGGQTSSDFPVVLEDAMHKLLLQGFMAQNTTYARFVRIGDVSDFREWKRLVPGLLGGFDRKNEAGEYVQKNIPDAERQSISADERGNVLTIDRRVLVNDDIGYIQTMASGLGMAGARGIDRDVYDLLAANPKLADGNALFHATRGNLAATGAAPGTDTMARGADAMAAQTAPGADGEYLDIGPAASVSRHTIARDIQVIVDSQYDPDAANKLQRPNKVRGLVGDIVGTPRLAGNAWYLFADPAMAPVIEVVFLNGQREPRLLQEESYRTGGLSWRPTLDYGVGAIDYRGAWKNPGA